MSGSHNNGTIKLVVYCMSEYALSLNIYIYLFIFMSIQTWLYQQTIVISLPDLRDVGLQTMVLVKSLLLLEDQCKGRPWDILGH